MESLAPVGSFYCYKAIIQVDTYLASVAFIYGKQSNPRPKMGGGSSNFLFLVMWQAIDETRKAWEAENCRQLCSSYVLCAEDTSGDRITENYHWLCSLYVLCAKDMSGDRINPGSQSMKNT